MAQDPAVSTPADDARAPTTTDGTVALARGLLVVRWALVAWMTVLALDGVRAGDDAAPAVLAVGIAGVWTAWLTAARPRWTLPVLTADLLAAAALVGIGALQPWLATVYPVTAALTWGAVRGVRAGLAAGSVLGTTSLVLALPLAADEGLWARALWQDAVYFVLAGVGMGFVTEALTRSAAQVRAAQAAEVAAIERAARLTERESIGRAIHDSVLQSLALVHKRGRELADRPVVDGAEVAELADLAAAQERTLRHLILHDPGEEDVPRGEAALRDRLERAAEAVDGRLGTSVTAVGPIRLPAGTVDQVGAAVDQAIANALRHAQASHLWLFADLEGDDVVVSVRDDGVGFTFDERALRADGKYGLLRSIRGRIEELGGTVDVDTAPGRGTELELRIPAPTRAGDVGAGERAGGRGPHG
jgi:signal transduction histidine kinase